MMRKGRDNMCCTKALGQKCVKIRFSSFLAISKRNHYFVNWTGFLSQEKGEVSGTRYPEPICSHGTSACARARIWGPAVRHNGAGNFKKVSYTSNRSKTHLDDVVSITYALIINIVFVLDVKKCMKTCLKNPLLGHRWTFVPVWLENWQQLIWPVCWPRLVKTIVPHCIESTGSEVALYVKSTVLIALADWVRRLFSSLWLPHAQKLLY